MKVTVAKVDLREALASVIPAVAVKPQVPILSGIYLEARGLTLRLRGTNNTQEILATIPANVEAEGAVVVAGGLLNSIAAKLGGEIVTLAEQEGVLMVKSEAARFELPKFDVSDFPLEQQAEWGFAARYKIAAFKELLKAIVICAGKDISRPILTGVHFWQVGETLTLTATNGHWIGRARLNSFDGVEGEMSAILPAQVCWALANSLDGEILTLSVSKNSARFEYGNVRLTATLIEGGYPDSAKIFNAAKARRARLKVAELLAALSRIGIIALRSEYTQFFLKFQDEGLEIRAAAKDVGEALEHVDLELEGGALDVAFNIKYVLSMLRGLRTQEVIFELGGELEPALMRGAGDDGLTYAITPVRVR